MSKQITVFIVEDNKVFNLALQADIETAFKHLPIKIHSFETGEKCMEKLKEEKPQVVILDYHLNSNYPSAADGIKILDSIKHVNKASQVIILTSDDNTEIAMQSFKHGASDYVVKTETKFRKINYSLNNIFNAIQAKREALKYKRLLIALFVSISLLMTTIAVFFPSLL